MLFLTLGTTYPPWRAPATPRLPLANSCGGTAPTRPTPLAMDAAHLGLALVAVLLCAPVRNAAAPSALEGAEGAATALDPRLIPALQSAVSALNGDISDVSILQVWLVCTRACGQGDCRSAVRPG